MSTLTPSRNPFRSNPPTPNVTGTSMSPETTERPSSLTMTMPDNRAAQSPPPSFSAPVSPPPSVVLSPVPADETRRIPPDRDLDGIPLEEPPPYTPRPAANSGETTVEHGPRRAFQPPPSAPTPQTNWSPQNHVMHTGNSSASLTSPPSSVGRSGSLFQQLTSSLNQVIQNLNNPVDTSHWTGQGGSYPGQQQGPSQSQPYHPPPPHPPPPSGRPSMNASTSSRFEPPPRHPQSLSSSAPPGAAHRALAPSENMRRHSSEFARDFYAAGAGDVQQRDYDPPTGPPPPPPRPTATDTRRGSIPNDDRPTTTPHLGHPLLKDGKLLVFPKGYECEKCMYFSLARSYHHYLTPLLQAVMWDTKTPTLSGHVNDVGANTQNLSLAHSRTHSTIPPLRHLHSQMPTSNGHFRMSHHLLRLLRLLHSLPPLRHPTSAREGTCPITTEDFTRRLLGSGREDPHLLVP